MRVYDVVFEVRGSISETEQKKAVKTVKDLLKDVKISKEDEWGEKTLAYPIKKEKTGVYYFLAIEGETIPSDLEKKILANEHVLRHLVIRTK